MIDVHFNYEVSLININIPLTVKTKGVSLCIEQTYALTTNRKQCDLFGNE
jgi:hypothetical protein